MEFTFIHKEKENKTKQLLKVRHDCRIWKILLKNFSHSEMGRKKSLINKYGYKNCDLSVNIFLLSRIFMWGLIKHVEKKKITKEKINV